MFLLKLVRNNKKAHFRIREVSFLFEVFCPVFRANRINIQRPAGLGIEWGCDVHKQGDDYGLQSEDIGEAVEPAGQGRA